MVGDPDSGGEPQLFGECTECGRTYPVQSESKEELRPIGTDGSCACGNETFTTVDDV